MDGTVKRAYAARLGFKVSGARNERSDLDDLYFPLLTRVTLLLVLLSCALGAESLQTVLKRSGVPLASMLHAELQQEIISYAVATGNPFLLAYYDYSGTSALSGPLHLIRYDRSHPLLTRTAVSKLDAAFSDFPSEIRNDCLGSVLKISEKYGRIYVDTHINPSAGCVLVFSLHLSLKAALSGALTAALDPTYAILEMNEVHFTSVSPLRLKVVDFERRSTNQIYPPDPDPFRNEYAQRIRAHMPSKAWCAQTNSQCDPLNFDCELDRPVAVNAASKSFAFIAHFDSGGFGADAARSVPPERVAYVYRLENRLWKHNEARAADLRWRWGVDSIQELVSLPSSVLFDQK